MNRNTLVLWLVTVFTLGSVGWNIYQKEQILEHGTTVLLQLGPVDPRSLMQGDYMILRYAINRQIRNASHDKIEDGHAVVALDSKQQVATFKRIHDNKTPLKANEHLLKFRKRSLGVRVASEAFFFQEGHARDFTGAGFGELKVAANGDAILVGLRDRNHQPLTYKPANKTDKN